MNIFTKSLKAKQFLQTVFHPPLKNWKLSWRISFFHGTQEACPAVLKKELNTSPEFEIVRYLKIFRKSFFACLLTQYLLTAWKNSGDRGSEWVTDHVTNPSQKNWWVEQNSNVTLSNKFIIALLLVHKNQYDNYLAPPFFKAVSPPCSPPTLCPAAASLADGRWKKELGGLGEWEQVGVKTEEKERGQGSTGAMRGGGLHIDMQSDRSIDRFFTPSEISVCVRARVCAF